MMAVTVERPRGYRVAEYDAWVKEQGIPVHRGYFVDDLKTVEVGPWKERGTNGCFLELVGQEGWTQICVEEIPPGATSKPFKMAPDEIVYVADGRGFTSIWAEGEPKIGFEWGQHGVFLVPGNFWCELSNMQGTRPSRVVHYSYLPMGMEAIRDRKVMFESPVVDKSRVYAPNEFYSAAQVVSIDGVERSNIWRAAFFPNTLAWDKWESSALGVGEQTVHLRFGSTIRAHMSTFEPFTYKKAHRHGPGTILIMLEGEGYSLMWPEGRERVVCPWHVGSGFVPPNRWFHHHFVLSPTPARALALHGSRLDPGVGENVEDYARNELQYWQEDPSIRQMFEEELARRGFASRMPPECYTDRNFDPEWGRQGGGGRSTPYSTDLAARVRDHVAGRGVD